MRWLLFALCLGLAGLSPSAAAQPTVRASDAVTRGLVAQYEAALIRDRRLADDRETRLIAGYEGRLRDLRALIDRGERAAEARLAEARTQFAAYVAPIAARDSEARQLVEGYQAQLTRDLSQASSEQLAALQRFADGNQEAGFTQYQVESARRAVERQHQIEAAAQAAAQAAHAAGAADARQLASLGETMRLNGRKTTAEVIALYETASALDPSVAAPWLALARLYMDANRIEASSEAAERGLAANASLLERVQLQLARGDAFTALGRLPEARAAREVARDSARQRVTVDSEDAEAQRQLAVSLYRFADTAAGQGELPAARQANEESLAILRRLVAADPSNMSLQRNLIDALRGAGNTRGEQGDGESALTHYNESLGLARSLASADPSNADLQRVLSRALAAVGGWQETSAGRLVYFQESLAIHRRLAAADASNEQAQHFVAATLRGIGVNQRAQGDLTSARASYEEALLIDRRLAAADPSNVTVQYSLAEDLGVLGDLQIEQGEAASALVSYQESVAVYRRIVAAETSSTVPHRRLSDGLLIMGDLQTREGDLAGARSSYEEALEVNRRIAAIDPRHQRALWVSMERMALNFPNGGVTWTDLARVMEDLDARGLIAASDQPALEQARANAARERTAAQ